MRDSIGGGILLNLVVIFAGLVMVFFISILSYSKAYRIKNRIVELIEKYEVYVSKDASWNAETHENGQYDVVDALTADLKNAGYDPSYPEKCNNIRRKLVDSSSGKYEDDDLSHNLNNYGYNYCVFKVDKDITESSKYYVVVTFVRFEVPIIEDILTFPVYGETKILGKNYDY